MAISARRQRRRRLLMLLFIGQLLCLMLWGVLWPRSQTIELSFVIPQDEVAPWQQLSRAFEQAHPGVRISLVTDPDTTYTTDQRKAIYTADFQANQARYDLVYMDIIWVAQFVDQLQDLTPLVRRDGLDLRGFLPSELEAGRYGDGLYRLPMRADVGLLYYRQDLLAEPPATLNQLNQTVDRLKQQGQTQVGYLWQGRSYEGLVVNFVEALASLGGRWIDPATGQPELDSPAAIAAARLLRQLIATGVSPTIVTDYTEQASLEAFLSEPALLLRGWPYFRFAMEALSDNVAISPPLAFGEKPGVGCRGGWGFGIPKNAAHGDLAWEAIQYFTSIAAQKEFVLTSGFLPSRPELFQDADIVTRYPQMPDMLRLLQSASTFRPAIPQYGEASEILQEALGKVLRNQQPAAAAMAQAQIETAALLDRQ